ncbi:type II toxin-antitoxin system antitoxin DNA ADP-ribosyl glycohydrolase DarG [Ralstonia solanacearum]|uniref:type II toxin-antitoxin system antitoxin DNA ADP-ribosyl glycohydrolase DarG n=1 Tax=Ralstonia solanacearum TaxID=305 RepID=UPI0005C4E112|nr:macro domain-containing protein [Ralstonia solanacearum]MBB6591168.1 macro domain-containing protein [Ralstonia solanacearum]MBB6595362.1 macro domain-containing protein [Ralstonia solanacearum]MDB0541374.1 macro domain-containing protein [Ralstonia solanacearum]MDB0550712.1 macro domain-containing protein [Ralstonia solanacearum]MDB0556323.1 macro domain-containing protein [Ralstonia solanacearum]
MIEYTNGNILHADVEALVNTVNCVGIMGRGIALQFKNAYPENFEAYATACKREVVTPGRMFVFSTGWLANPRYIINFPTKRHWKGKSRIEDIESGLVDLCKVIRERQIRSIAIPPLGSGLGGLDWGDVRPRIEQALSPLEGVRVLVYEPNGAPESDKMVHKRDVPNMTAGRAALVELVSRYLKGLLDPTVSLLEVHKLMYFMQAAGEPLRLKFRAAHYGPYAENLRHVMNAIEGHFIAGYADGGDAPDKALSLVPGAEDEASRFLREYDDTRSRFDRVSELVDGFESPYGLELLSTVHWVAAEAPGSSVDELTHRVHEWSDRKRQFSPRQIRLAADVLSRKGWIAPLSMH